MRKKRILKKWFEKLVLYVLGFDVCFIFMSIDTLNKPFNQIIDYLIALGIVIIRIGFNLYLLKRYTYVLDIPFEEE